MIVVRLHQRTLDTANESDIAKLFKHSYYTETTPHHIADLDGNQLPAPEPYPLYKNILTSSNSQMTYLDEHSRPLERERRGEKESSHVEPDVIDTIIINTVARYHHQLPARSSSIEWSRAMWACC